MAAPRFAEQLDAFRPPPPSPAAIERLHPPASPADYAELAAFSRDGMALNALAQRVANAILDALGSVTVWEIRVVMGHKQWLANDGTETLDGLGHVGVDMKLVAVGRERPPEWAKELLEKSHGNVNTIWVRPKDVATYNPLRRHRSRQAPASHSSRNRT